jgi:conjugal transfer pilus assembly protein TraE
MELRRLKTSFLRLLGESRLKDAVILLLVLANLISVFGWLRTRETVVLVPPQMDQRMAVSFASASASYSEAWALYVTELMGNIIPGNVEFVGEALSGLMSPDVYHDLRERLARQIEAIKEESLVVRFEPQQLLYEAETDKVFIHGRSHVAGPGGELRQRVRTFEYRVAMRFGRPWVTHFAVYEGQPRTAAYLKTNPKEDS